MSAPMFRYDLKIEDPRTHLLRIDMSFVVPAADPRLRIPVWTPGSYLVREFGRYIEQVEAFDSDGLPLPIEKTAKDTWCLRADAGRAVRIRYAAYCNELTVRTPHIDASHAFFTASNVLFYVDGALDHGSVVFVQAPDGWTTFCSLDVLEDGGFFAPDYDTLADTPFEIGPHRFSCFDVLGVPHRLIFWGDKDTHIDVDSLQSDITKIVEANAAVFGGALPYRRYDFIFHITHDLRGGLEHLCSTVLATPWRYFEKDSERPDLLGLLCHEHFHVWNVKRIKPRGLVPFDYSRENFTRGLWISEGATSYFDDLGCVRAKVITPAEYLNRIADSISRYRQIPGRFAQPVDEASLDAWIRLYRPDENTPNRTVSYYLKGALVHLALDLTIRLRTESARSLDDVFALLYRRWQLDGAAFDDRNFDAIVVEATGVDVAEQLAAWVQRANDPPLETLLASFGLTLRPEAARGVDHGMTLDAPGDVVVRNVYRNGPAERAGLCAGDVLVAIDSRRLSSSTHKTELDRLKPGKPATLHAFRRNVLFETTLVCNEPAPSTFKLEPDPGADDRARALRTAWIGEIA